MLLVTSSLMVELYIKHCDGLKNGHSYYDGSQCGEAEAHFLILPVFGFFTMVVWVST